MTRDCRICGKRFTVTFGGEITCSSACHRAYVAETTEGLQFRFLASKVWMQYPDLGVEVWVDRPTAIVIRRLEDQESPAPAVGRPSRDRPGS